MTTAAQLRSRYAREAVTTASPVRLVTMLYDRLVRDLDDAELAISLADPQAAHALLRHAQDIVQELSSEPGRLPAGTAARACSASTPGCSSGSSPPTCPRTPRSSSSAARSSSRCATRGTRPRTSTSSLHELQLAQHARRLRAAPGPAVAAGGRGPVRRGGRLRAARRTCRRCRGCSSPAPWSCRTGRRRSASGSRELRDRARTAARAYRAGRLMPRPARPPTSTSGSETPQVPTAVADGRSSTVVVVRWV